MSENYYATGTDLRYKPITHEEERALCRKAKAGDAQAKDEFFRLYLLFAAKEGRRIARGNLPENDIVSASNFALVKAFERFDCERPNRFFNYLRPFIRGEVAALWRGDRHSARGLAADDDREQPESEPSEEPKLEEADERRFLLRVMEKCKDKLKTDEIFVLEHYYCVNEMTFEQIGELLNLSRSRVQQLHKSALAKLRKDMGHELEVLGEPNEYIGS